MSANGYAVSSKREVWLSRLRVLGLLFASGLLMALASFLLVRSTISGSKTQLVECMVLAVLPILTYLAITRPFIFPFAFFVIAVPVDNLLGITNLYSNSNALMGQTQHVATVTKVLGLLSGVAFSLWLVRTRKFVKPPTAAILSIVLLIWMGLSVLWALDPNTALQSLTTYAELIILFFVVSIMPVNSVDFAAFVGAVIFGALCTGAYSVYQYYAGGGIAHFNFGQAVINTLHQLKGEQAGIDPNALSAAFLLPIALVMTAFLSRKWSWVKIGLGIVLAVLLAGIFVTASRGGVVALLVMFGYMMVRSRYGKQVFTVCLVALTASVVKALSGGAQASVWGRFADAARTGGSGRTSIWRVGWDAFKHHFLLGAGVGNFPTAYDQSYIRVFEFYNQGWHRVSHDTPLGLAVELGLIGLIIGCLGAYWQFRMLNFISKANPLYDLRVGLESAFVGLFVASIFLWILPGKYTWVTFELIAVTRAYALGRPTQHALAHRLFQFAPYLGRRPAVRVSDENLEHVSTKR
jgi:exopolysaccharide production protein ExoQ